MAFTIKEQYCSAKMLENKYRDAPRAGWVEKGSRAKSNQAIMVPRAEVIQLAECLSSATYNKLCRLYEILNLQHYMSELAEGESDTTTCTKCHNYYRMGWLTGNCPYCEAEQAAIRFVDELLGGVGE